MFDKQNGSLKIQMFRFKVLREWRVRQCDNAGVNVGKHDLKLRTYIHSDHLENLKTNEP